MIEAATGRLRASGFATLLLAATVVAAFGGTLLSVGAPASVFLATVIQLLFVAPGVVIVARTQPKEVGWLPAVAFGPIVGFGSSSLTLLAFWAAGGRGAWLFLAAPVTALALAWPAARLRGRWRLADTNRSDLRMLLFALLLVPVLVGRPFAMVGVETSRGVAYRQYFTADYVWRRAVVAELAKGDFLPKNPYYIDDPLHYYWLPHLLDAVDHRVRPGVDLDELLLTRTILIDAMFVAGLYGLARQAVPVPWAALAGVVCAFLATSAEALVAAATLWRDGAPLGTLRFLNIDAISRWNYNGMPIDGLQRILWYQPHHAVGYLLGFLGVMAVARRTRPRDPAVFAVAGLLLAMSTLVSSFAGLMFTAIAAVYEATNTVVRRAWVTAIFNAAYAALPLALGSALVMALHYVDQPPDELSVVRLGLNPLAPENFWIVTAMSFGPAVIMGSLGAAAAWQRRLRDLLPFAAVLPVVWWFYFYVDIRDHQDVYVGWRVGHLTFMALIPFIGVAFLAVRAWRGAARVAGAAVLAVAVLLGLPTTIVDAFNTQDVVLDVPEGGWNHSEFISRNEQDGLQWLREHTSSDAVVQVDTQTRAANMWAFIPAFAERRMAVGLPLSMVPLEKYQVGAGRIHRLYHTDSATKAYELAVRFGIDYLVVGPPERLAHHGIEARWGTTPDLLPLVFRNDALSIFRVRPPRE